MDTCRGKGRGIIHCHFDLKLYIKNKALQFIFSDELSDEFCNEE